MSKRIALISEHASPLGALGGMASAGILGMFVGATLLALGYQIFTTWVATNPD